MYYTTYNLVQERQNSYDTNILHATKQEELYPLLCLKLINIH